PTFLLHSAPLTRGCFFAARLPVSRTAAGPRTAPRHGIGNHLPLPAFALLGRNVERFSANGWLGRNVERPWKPPGLSVLPHALLHSRQNFLNRSGLSSV